MSKVVAFKRSNNSAPTTVNGKVPPIRKRNKDVRSREYLTQDEVDALMVAAGSTGRHRHRDRTLILLAYRHGLRVSELISLRWDQVDLKQGHLHVNRLKNGTPSTHPIRGPEIRALRTLRREYPKSPYLFVTERGGPLTASTVRKLVAGRVTRLVYRFQCIPICSDTQQVSTWQIRATIQGRSSTTSDTNRLPIRLGIRSWRPTDSMISGPTRKVRFLL